MALHKREEKAGKDIDPNKARALAAFGKKIATEKGVTQNKFAALLKKKTKKLEQG